jgi:hypothetical protein
MTGLLLLLALAAAPNPPGCKIDKVNELTPTTIEVVFDCDMDLSKIPNDIPTTVFQVSGGVQKMNASYAGATQKTAESSSSPNFGGIVLTLPQPLRPDVPYTLHIDTFTVGTDKIKDEMVITTKGTIEAFRYNPYEVFAIFPTTITLKNIAVEITRANLKVPDIAIRHSELTGGNRGAILTLTGRVANGDKVTITATTTEGARIITAVVDKVDFAKPGDRKTAAFWLALTTEAGENQKPNFALDWKLEHSRQLGLRWTQGPKLDMVVATQDQNGTNNAVVGWNFERYQFFNSGPNSGPVSGLVYDITPTVELAKGLVNRDALLDVTAGLVLRSTQHFTFRPTAGFDAGRNIGLKKDYRQYEDYTIKRAKLNAYAATVWVLPPSLRSGVQRISFSIDTTAFWRGTSEIDSTPIPPRLQTKTSGKATYALTQGMKYYGLATLDFKLADYFGIALVYTRGEQPLLYENNNKVSLKFTYAY